jgi:hypothetical protein
MRRTRKALLATLLVSITVALGVALSGLPNVELMTVTVFISGYLLGWRLGLAVGAASITVHSLFNPLGAALPPLLFSQVLGFCAIGLAGAIAGPLIAHLGKRWVAFVVCGISGFVLTLLYDVLTNIGAFLTISGERSVSNLWRFVVAGVLFTIMHTAWNTGLFVVVVKPVLAVLAKYRVELSQGE